MYQNPPLYTPGPPVVYRSVPRRRSLVVLLSDALDNEEIIELNKQVDVDGRDPAKVARDWMTAKGFIS